MKKILLMTMALLSLSLHAEDKTIIRIATQQTDLLLQVGDNNRLYQTYFGQKLVNNEDTKAMKWYVHASSDGSVCRRGWETYPGSGGEDFFEPALAVTHADGNMTTYLYYVSSEQSSVNGGTHTTILLHDDTYPVEVKLHYVAYEKENVIKTWSEITHSEKKPISLWSYASAMLYFCRQHYYLTEFSSDWAKEAQMSSQELLFGKKIVDTKLGSRAAMHAHAMFILGLDEPAHPEHGEVLMGTLGWTGNFRFTFEVDNVGNLRVIPAINPYASTYTLPAGETFTTPEFIFTLSYNGTSEGSRNLHDWARRYSLRDGMGSRMTLLNNWENTRFDFDEQSLAELMKDAKKLGVDMFLLDDGWFGNKHQRNDDHAGLGDWQPNHDKLPGGTKALTEAAKVAGVKFGIWIEPEMVNPSSELFEQHPEWVIHQPNRETYYYRNQLVLDLSNPDVQDYVFGIVDGILSDNPDIAYFKWDCNSPITNIYSPYLKDRQGNLYIDHVRGIYRVLDRVTAKYPDTQMMLCSGGGGRCDFEALKHFTEFWCSDDTDPVERLYIQWGFSHFFPAKAMCAHVTSWNRTASVKFRTDVASMCKLGFDIGLQDLTEDELAFCHSAVQNWNDLQPAIMDGDQYRLVSPYESDHTALNYVSKDGNLAVLFAYDIHPRYYGKLLPVKLQGLDPTAKYKLEEINLMPGVSSRLECHGNTYSGDYLMKVGIDVLSFNTMQSHVIKLTKQQ